MRRTPPLRRWQVAVPLLVALSLGGTVAGCAMVESDVAGKSRAALADRGIEGVSVSVRYRDVTLRGPAELRDRALAAVSGLGAVHDTTYAPTTSAPVAVAPVLGARYDGRRLILTGTVSAVAQRTALADAARAARPAATIDDRLDVDADAATVDVADLGLFVAVVRAMPAALRSGSATLEDGRLTVAGERRTATAGALAAPLRAARSGGLDVTDNSVPGAAVSAQPQVVERRLANLLAGTTIRFDTASADIRPESVALVDRVAAVVRPAVRANRILTVRVEGHTDNQGNAARNQNLSLRRARAVVDALVARGVPRGRLVAIGYGASRPVADNGTQAGREQNRRIAFTVLGG
ncbi:MAG: OmpA family protein [Thermoleophilia bacterium]|nr:OmpA family protein [Thermoleophilia bacterium]